jgi:hypothetical protein
MTGHTGEWSAANTARSSQPCVSLSAILESEGHGSAIRYALATERKLTSSGDGGTRCFLLSAYCCIPLGPMSNQLKVPVDSEGYRSNIRVSSTAK